MGSRSQLLAVPFAHIPQMHGSAVGAIQAHPLDSTNEEQIKQNCRKGPQFAIKTGKYLADQADATP